MLCNLLFYDDKPERVTKIIKKISDNIFRLIDTNNSGILSYNELMRGFLILNFPLPNILKTDTFDKKQFYELNYKQLKKNVEMVYEDLLGGFDAYDKDHDGYINKSELDEKTIALIDHNGDNKIDFYEYFYAVFISEAPTFKVFNDPDGFFLVANLNNILRLDEYRKETNNYTIVFLNGEKEANRLSIVTNTFIYYFRSLPRKTTYKIVLYKNGKPLNSDYCMLYL